MSKNKTSHPTMQESADMLKWISGGEVRFPFFQHRHIVALPDPSYLEPRFNLK